MTLFPHSSAANGARFPASKRPFSILRVAKSSPRCRCARNTCRCACNRRPQRFRPGATPGGRAGPLFFRYRQLVEENFDRICASVSREHGKTLAEARGSAYRGIEKVEYACSIPSLLMGETWKISRAALIAKRCINRSAFASASRRSIFRRWCRCGCSRRDGVRKHVRAQAKRKSSAHRVAHHRIARESRLTQRRVEHRSRRPRMRGCVAHASEGESDFVRRLDAGRETHF